MAASLGKALRSARMHLGLSQADVANLAGIAPSHLVRLESGEKSSPRFETVIKVAAALGLSLDALAVNAGSEKKPPAASETRRRAALAQAALMKARGALKGALADIEAEIEAQNRT